MRAGTHDPERERTRPLGEIAVDIERELRALLTTDQA